MGFKIAIYGRQISVDKIPYIQEVIDRLAFHNVKVLIYKEFKEYIEKNGAKTFDAEDFEVNSELIDYKHHVKCVFSLGGDGTLLDTLNFVKESGIPVLGINLGRLGFLASINKCNIQEAVDAVIQNRFTLDSRVILNVEGENLTQLKGIHSALNEITIHKKGIAPMIVIHTYINGEFLNSYWADGLIISTPTGSTSYSLSCGGPIIFPQSENLVITPICPHNLTVRPIVISDSSELSFVIDSRTDEFLLTLDARTAVVPTKDVRFTIKKEHFKLNLVRLYNENYLVTLREKLMWGLDARN